MTRKDYELIASAIDRARAAAVKATTDAPYRRGKLAGIERTATAIATDLAAENPRFDSGKFHAAAAFGPLYRAAINEESLAREIGPAATTKG